MLNRSQAPPIHAIDQLVLPLPELIHLDNGIPVYVTNMGTQQVVRLEMIFNAGRPYEKKPLVSRATTALLKEGTQHYNSAQIAETLDFYGASLNFPFNLDTGSLVLYCLSRHFESLMPIILEMLEAPEFPKDELEAFVKRNQKSLLTDLAKPDVVAYRTITEKIFGEDHPYGYNSSIATYEALERQDLLEHFGRCYGADNCTLYLSGRITDDVIGILNTFLGSLPRKGKPERKLNRVGAPAKGTLHVDHPDSVQTAVRIGRRLVNRHHSDYAGFFVLNTILGGYFGSRLMANIREDKGYTYNIYSTLDVMQKEGCFYIGTEVGNDFVGDTLHQIRYELKQLMDHKVGEEELNMVRNYLMGTFLSMLDGPFNVGELVRTIVEDELDFSFFSDLVEKVRCIQAGELQTLANKYLAPEDQWEVIVG